jgi:hypothetical protein
LQIEVRIPSGKSKPGIFAMRMVISAFAFFSVLSLSSLCFADSPAARPANRQAAKSATTVKITLHPAAAPTPSLKYLFRPPFLERQEGNAAVHYLMVNPMEQQRLADSELFDLVVRLLKMPLAELRQARDENLKADVKVEKRWADVHKDPLDWIFREIDRGNQCAICNFETPQHDPEWESVRVMPGLFLGKTAYLLCLRARLEMADGDFDGAARTLRCIFEFGGKLGSDPSCIIRPAVGCVIIDHGLRQVETFIQQPEAPNLYWALTSLPRPCIDLSRLMEVADRELYQAMPYLRDLDQKQLSPDQWWDLLEKVVDHLVKNVPAKDKKMPSEAYKTMLLVAVAEGSSRAKEYLVAHGRKAAEVEVMPDAQAVLLYSTHIYDEICDQFRRSFLLPYPESGKERENAKKRLDNTIAFGVEILPLSYWFAPRSMNSPDFIANTDRKIAALRIFEAIRMYGASHDGRLPKALSDITAVPIPNDPISGSPFFYHCDGNKALLVSRTPSSFSPGTLSYEIETKPDEKPHSAK